MNGRLYRVGTTQDSPFEVYHLAGVAFPKQTERVELDKFTGETKRSVIEGDVLRLTDGQVAACKAAAASKRVRIMVNPGSGEVTQASIFVAGSRRYQPDPKDRSVADFVYMQEVEESPHATQVRRPSLTDEAEAAKAPKAEAKVESHEPAPAGKRR